MCENCIGATLGLPSAVLLPQVPRLLVANPALAHACFKLDRTMKLADGTYLCKKKS